MSAILEKKTDLSKLLHAMNLMADLDPYIQLYQVKAERIQGEPNCMVKLPCKYEGENLVLLVGIARPDEDGKN
jgi:hypothetical protein